VPVPRRAAHVGREDGDAPGDEGLEEGTVAGTLLRFGAAMEEDDGRPRSGGRRRAIEPARELEAVVGAEALERGARARRDPAWPLPRDAGPLARRAVEPPDGPGRRRSLERHRQAATVVGEAAVAGHRLGEGELDPLARLEVNALADALAGDVPEENGLAAASRQRDVIEIRIGALGEHDRALRLAAGRETHGKEGVQLAAHVAADVGDAAIRREPPEIGRAGAAARHEELLVAGGAIDRPDGSPAARAPSHQGELGGSVEIEHDRLPAARDDRDVLRRHVFELGHAVKGRRERSEMSAAAAPPR
jgi:hypothetical protein